LYTGAKIGDAPVDVATGQGYLNRGLVTVHANDLSARTV
jgi:hypothetical protein